MSINAPQLYINQYFCFKDDNNVDEKKIYNGYIFNHTPSPYSELLVGGIKDSKAEHMDYLPFLLGVDTNECAAIFTNSLLQFILNEKHPVTCFHFVTFFLDFFNSLGKPHSRYRKIPIESVSLCNNKWNIMKLAHNKKLYTRSIVSGFSSEELVKYLTPVMKQLFVVIIADIKRTFKKTIEI